MPEVSFDIVRDNLKPNEMAVIKGAAVCTRGPALGHGIWLDREFLSELVRLGNNAQNGLKARFTHPGLSSDGLGKFLGRWRNFRLDGDIVRGDLHLLSIADKSPDGPLGSYVLGMVEEDATALGTSIVFKQDPDAEARFRRANCDTKGNFLSPDPLNTDNFDHARPASCHACDVVDEPAANPSGFFSAADELPARAESLLAYAFELTAIEPEYALLGGIPPEKLKIFLKGFLGRHNLRIVPVEAAVTPHPADDPVPPSEPRGDDTPKIAFTGLMECFAMLKTGIPYDLSHASGCDLAPKGDKFAFALKGATVESLKASCAWVDSATPERVSSYKLAHHDAEGRVVLFGLAAAAARLPLIDSNEESLAVAMDHLSAHYAEFDEVAPWKRAPEAWTAYRAILGQLKLRGGFSDAEIVTALRSAGLSLEADGVGGEAPAEVPATPPVEAPVTPPVEAPAETPPADTVEEEIEGLSAADQVALREMLDRSFLERTGGLSS